MINSWDHLKRKHNEKSGEIEGETSAVGGRGCEGSSSDSEQINRKKWVKVLKTIIIEASTITFFPIEGQYNAEAMAHVNFLSFVPHQVAFRY